MPKFTPEQNEQYYIARLDSFKLHHSKGMEYRSICPLHGGSNNSQLWVNLAEGNFYCFTCQAKGGGAYTFEQEFLKAQHPNGVAPSNDEVVASLEKIMGTPFVQRTHSMPVETGKTKGWDRRQARDRYLYTDEDGEEIFSVWRFVDRTGNKVTPPDHPCACRHNPDGECEPGCVEGRVWGNKGLRRVLYRLPDVLQSIVVFVVEGERNANELSRALASFISKNKGLPFGDLVLDRVAVTTNPGGAAQWKPELGFGRYFFRKTVIKLGDNDAAGRMHDEAVCADVAKWARRVFTLSLPVGEGEDISDYLAAHPIEEFLKLLKNRVEWQLPRQTKEPLVAEEAEPRTLLVRPSALVSGMEPGGDWLVDGLIERGTRGLVVAPPKTGKSLLFLDMVLCLATGQRFLGARPYSRPVRCAVISREDGPSIVHRRLQQLAAGHGLSALDVDANIRVNTSKQSSQFKIDHEVDLREMAEWLKAERVEFCVLDVFSKLHSQQENSTDDMVSVMQGFDELARLSGAQVCVIHHTNKTGDVRGSSAIRGWADYVVTLEQDQEDVEVKHLRLQTKQSGAIAPRSIRYWQSEDLKVSKIRLLQEVA